MGVRAGIVAGDMDGVGSSLEMWMGYQLTISESFFSPILRLRLFCSTLFLFITGPLSGPLARLARIEGADGCVQASHRGRWLTTTKRVSI